MSLVVQETGKSSGDFQIAPAGNHIAICYSLVELGHQYSAKYDKWQPKVQIAWELPTEPMADGRPFVVSQRYTASLGELASLRRDLEGWRGRPFTEEELAGFDLKNILGKPCMVNVVHNKPKDRTYANVKSVASVPKGFQVPQQVNPSVLFELGDQGYDAEIFASLPEWMRNTILESRELKSMNQDYSQEEPQGTPEFDDEIAF
jgi:hypothetical protein